MAAVQVNAKRAAVNYCVCIAMVLGSMAAAKCPAFAQGKSLLRDVVRQSNRVKTIDAAIIQYIKEGSGPREIFRGRYRADGSGKFRVDYAVPSRQIVVHDGRGLYWYYPDDALLYRIERKGIIAAAPSPNSARELDAYLSRQQEVRYAGRKLAGFFTLAHHYVFTNTKNGTSMDVLIDGSKKVILSKTIRNSMGQEVVRERYENFKTVDNTVFPVRVIVMVRSSRGITQNITEYSDIVINSRHEDSLFTMKGLNLPPRIVIKRVY